MIYTTSKNCKNVIADVSKVKSVNGKTGKVNLTAEDITFESDTIQFIINKLLNTSKVFRITTDDVKTEWVLGHNLNTKIVSVEVIDESDYETAFFDVKRIDENNLKIRSANPIGNARFIVIVKGEIK